MTINNTLGLIAAFWLAALPAYAAYKYEPGEEVLTNCREIYTKGIIKA